MKKPSHKIITSYTLLGILCFSIHSKYGIEFVAPTVGVALGWLYYRRSVEKLNAKDNGSGGVPKDVGETKGL